MAHFGQRWTPQDQAHSLGGPLDRVVGHIASRVHSDPEHVTRILVDEIEHEVATEVAFWMPGARSLLADARAQGIPTAIVSNSWRVLLDLLVTNMDVQPDITVSSTEVSRPKPHPEPFLVGCRLLNARPALTWVVEDSPTGLAAGLAAGCWVLGVGEAVAGQTHPRLHTVPTLEAVSLASLGGDGIQNP